MQIVAKAPTRVDLAGGTLDLTPLPTIIDGSVTVNLALHYYCRAKLSFQSGDFTIHSRDGGETVTARRLAGLVPTGPLTPIILAAQRLGTRVPPFRLTTFSPVPRGSGLGASSALLLAVCAALNVISRQPVALAELLTIVAELEAAAAAAPSGYQDQLAAAYGGLSIFNWRRDWQPGRYERQAVPLDAAEANILANHFILLWTGHPHHSGSLNWQVLRAYLDGDGAARRGLHRINDVARTMVAALRGRDWPTAASLIGREWEARRSLAPGVSTPRLDELISTARQAGAWAGKACGAGGGGCLLIAVPPARREKVKAALAAAGGKVLPLAVGLRGLQVQVTG